jgi:hypothetical protein
MRTPHRPFTLHEAARIVGGQLHITHGYNCASRSGGPCGCLPTFTLRRSPKRKGGRR